MKNWKWCPDYGIFVNLENVNVIFLQHNEEGFFNVIANCVGNIDYVIRKSKNREDCEEFIDEIMGLNDE